jgi:cobalamin biosynthesis protein CobD/CbiB
MDIDNICRGIVVTAAIVCFVTFITYIVDFVAYMLVILVILALVAYFGLITRKGGKKAVNKFHTDLRDAWEKAKTAAKPDPAKDVETKE